MTTYFDNEIKVETTYFSKKNKTDKRKSAIYMGFTIYQTGIMQFKHSISTGIKINTGELNKGQMTGRNINAKNVEHNLNLQTKKADKFLGELSYKGTKTCSELLKEIQINAKEKITGKAPRKHKEEFISKMKTYSYSEIMTRCIKDKNISTGRQRGYNRSYELLKEYFQNEIPAIGLITEQDLETFKKWLKENHTLKQNTATDYRSKIATVIKYALKLKVLTVNPLPENFRGSFVDGNREVLSENECIDIIKINDETLSMTERVAKYCLLVQLLTGMGYSDMKDIQHSNIKYSENEGRYYIEKERNKTGIKFKVFLTDNAFYMVNKLKELTSSDTKPFNVPSIDYSLRMYKKIGEAAEIPTNITTYTLRHTFAVNYMENEGRIEDLAKILGHTLLKTTQIYGKISNKRLAEKTELLQQKSKIHQIQPLLKAV